jgi:hypothetical protein
MTDSHYAPIPLENPPRLRWHDPLSWIMQTESEFRGIIAIGCLIFGSIGFYALCFRHNPSGAGLQLAACVGLYALVYIAERRHALAEKLSMTNAELLRLVMGGVGSVLVIMVFVLFALQHEYSTSWFWQLMWSRAT